MAARAALGAVYRHLRQELGNLIVNSSKIGISKNDGFLLTTNMKWVQFSNLHIDIPKDLTKPTVCMLCSSIKGLSVLNSPVQAWDPST
ncbi:28S ribosomal protein S10, mitochondrial [Nannospalax galili]|uniref:28S ribosomal protein S10, mitochondrial n=1 Tax=Nannospalax galili TaxID=1026970 RepID=UPI0004ED7222|nr:28S ribosomal protein S10, mitochondrial [Nannospalax galili]